MWLTSSGIPHKQDEVIPKENKTCTHLRFCNLFTFSCAFPFWLILRAKQFSEKDKTNLTNQGKNNCYQFHRYTINMVVDELNIIQSYFNSVSINSFNNSDRKKMNKYLIIFVLFCFVIGALEAQIFPSCPQCSSGQYSPYSYCMCTVLPQMRRKYPGGYCCS